MNGQICSNIVMFELSMRCVVMTPFGVPVEPEVNRNFAIVSGPILAAACARASRASRP